MADAITRAAIRAYPYRWWLLGCFVAGPVLWMLGVRYLLTVPGFISPKTEWFLLKFTAVIFCWSWGFYLVAVLFHPLKGLLRPRDSLLVSACRALLLPALALVFLSAFLVFALVS